ncbi:MAG TPA: hypothetical protein VEQ63_01480 [Bryobacteraceae bacterium]|nr:hypothetical protein [Bryobacteraceae bacterium]
MSINATSYTVSIMLLMAFTIAIAIVRWRSSLESNWPLLYWIFITLVSFRLLNDTWNLRYIAAGLGSGLLLRFEFMNTLFARLIQVVELCVWAYVLYTGFRMVVNY